MTGTVSLLSRYRTAGHNDSKELTGTVSFLSRLGETPSARGRPGRSAAAGAGQNVWLVKLNSRAWVVVDKGLMTTSPSSPVRLLVLRWTRWAPSSVL